VSGTTNGPNGVATSSGTDCTVNRR
jgi:hypothetical protein